MKKFTTTALLILASICTITSCKKEKNSPAPVVPQRTVKFVLYTDQDYSSDNHTITFSLHAHTPNLAFSFDSVVLVTKVKDIPKKANQLVFERKFPTEGTLTAGFVYEIENVGVSWHLDTLAAGETSKVIEYPFQ